MLHGIADVAQLVAHHLAKVRVAGSNPVVRSFGGARARGDRSPGSPRRVVGGATPTPRPEGFATEPPVGPHHPQRRPS